MKPLSPPQPLFSLFAIAGLALAGMNSARADIVHLDDVIIDGSACIGFDCVNGESFGFDTLRLKENNLRIKFDDTSTSASFPNTDWQLTANETSNGGANKFSIDDISNSRTPMTIEANAPTNSLYVDDGGRLGLGTNTPVVDVHVKSGNTPTLRLEQDGSSGFGPQTWDVAGNEANFFVRDATSGSTLPFRLFPGAPSNALAIEGSTGHIGVGTTSPTNSVHVLENASGETASIRVEDGGGSGAETLLELSNNGPCRMSMFDTTTGTGGDTQYLINVTNDEWRLSEQSTGAVEFKVNAAGDVTITGDFITDANTYPDYVFRPGYDLMPLEKLGEFIETNGHLPNVPKEEQVKKEGLKIADLQIRMLEKIEELTLYTLEQQETIKALQERLEKVEGK